MNVLNLLLYLIIVCSSVYFLQNYFNTKLRVNFDGSCLKQDKVSFTQYQVVNIYTVCEINMCLFTNGKDFVLENVLFEAVKLTKNTDHDKYKYSGNSIGFDVRGSISVLIANFISISKYIF